jgi:hypothetical protein
LRRGNRETVNCILTENNGTQALVQFGVNK